MSAQPTSSINFGHYIAENVQYILEILHLSNLKLQKIVNNKLNVKADAA